MQKLQPLICVEPKNYGKLYLLFIDNVLLFTQINLLVKTLIPTLDRENKKQT